MTRQQRWAAGALGLVKAQRGQSIESDYRTLCLKMPILIKQSGLVQALSFMLSRDKEEGGQRQPGKLFCGDLARVYGVASSDDAGDRLLQAALGATELGVYLAMTRDLTDVSVWFRRFAQSELQGEQ